MKDIFSSCRAVKASDAARKAGVELRQQGDRYWAHCPVHEGDRTPSLCFYPDGGWHCFGCGAGGRDGVSFYAAFYRVGALEAARRAARDFGIAADTGGKYRRPAPREKPPARLLREAVEQFKAERWDRLCLLQQAAKKEMRRIEAESPQAGACFEDRRYTAALAILSRAELEQDELTAAPPEYLALMIAEARKGDRAHGEA